MKRQDCPHVPIGSPAPSRGDRCEACGVDGSIRACATCGYVGCCESQRAHDTQHSRATGHPIIRSLPSSERSFTWCYACNDFYFESATGCGDSGFAARGREGEAPGERPSADFESRQATFYRRRIAVPTVDTGAGPHL